MSVPTYLSWLSSCLLDLQGLHHGKYQISINQIQFGCTHTRTHTLAACDSNMSLFLSVAKYLHSLVLALGHTICYAYLFDLQGVWVCVCVYACVHICNCVCIFDCHLTLSHTYTKSKKLWVGPAEAEPLLKGNICVPEFYCLFCLISWGDKYVDVRMCMCYVLKACTQLVPEFTI